MSKKKYIQTSLSCPDAGLEVIEEKDDAMKTRVLCPYCGKETTVGETIMISGFVGCPACYWDEKDGLRDAGSRVHVATLRGFKPSMPVVYRACSQETPHVFAYKTFFKGDVEKIESKLAPLVPADGTVSFAMFNDVHCNHAIYSTLLDNVKKPVNFTVFAGDIMNSTDSEACVVHNLLAPLAYVSDKTGAAMWYLRAIRCLPGRWAVPTCPAATALP